MQSQKVNTAVILLIFLAGLNHSSSLIAGEPFMLVSEEEYLQQLDQKGVGHKKMQFKMRSISGINQESPLITINAPLVKSELYSPISIEINFKAPDDAKIQADSLKVMYGWLNLDITDRIRRHAQISHSGILAENVELPVGKHNITIEITDSLQRSTEKEVSFEIFKP